MKHSGSSPKKNFSGPNTGTQIIDEFIEKPVAKQQGAKLDIKTLENWLWDAACSIRGPIDAPKFKDYILPLVFVKRLSDVFDDEVLRLSEQFGSLDYALEVVDTDPSLVRFFIPIDARWSKIRKVTKGLGEQLTNMLRTITKANQSLQGTIDIVDFNITISGQRVIDDERLSSLVEILSDKRFRLGLNDVEPDILGRAYEYLLRKFAEGQGQTAGEFFTPKEVGWLIAYLLNPKQGQTVYDPACGSGGLLIKCQLELMEKDKDIQLPLKLYGQELNPVTFAIARMNMIIHDMEGEIMIGDSLKNPKFLTESSLEKFDLVVANPMWNQPGYNADFYENDPHDRFLSGYPPGISADWGWIQHIFSSLSDQGSAAIVLDTGSVSRGTGDQASHKERKIRKAFVDDDKVDGVILLPENLFYNANGPGIILILNNFKPLERKGKIIVVNAAKMYEKGKPKNFIPHTNIQKIVDVYHSAKDVDGFCKVVTIEDVSKKSYNLSPSRYVGSMEVQGYDEIPTVLEELSRSESEARNTDTELKNIFKMLGFTEWI